MVFRPKEQHSALTVSVEPFSAILYDCTKPLGWRIGKFPSNETDQTSVYTNGGVTAFLPLLTPFPFCLDWSRQSCDCLPTCTVTRNWPCPFFFSFPLTPVIGLSQNPLDPRVHSFSPVSCGLWQRLMYRVTCHDWVRRSHTVTSLSLMIMSALLSDCSLYLEGSYLCFQLHSIYHMSCN